MIAIFVIAALFAVAVYLLFNIKTGVMASLLVFAALAAFSSYVYVTTNEERMKDEVICDRKGGFFIQQGAENICVDRNSIKHIDTGREFK